MSNDLTSIIRKHALKNALDFGKANIGSVVGKVIAEMPTCKSDMKTTMQNINEIVNEVNKMTKDKIESELKNYSFIEKPKEEKKGFDIQNAEMGEVITRFPPEPSGYPHIGHAKAAFLDYEIAKQFNGKFILRFDDTNPEKEEQKFVEAIKEGLVWLGIKWDTETYTSDNIESIYAHCSGLIARGYAYICTCKQEQISELRTSMKECSCRNKSINEQEQTWDTMIQGKVKEGQAILRFKGDMKSLNTVMRDPTLARIITKKHYRQGTKYKVWPSYDLAVVVMDALESITHPARTKEYELRDELYYALCVALGFKRPNLIGFSRLEIKNAPISKRLLKPLVEEGKVDGWDDPRLPTLAGLKRRGVLPEAIRTFVLSFGLSKVESEPTWERLLVENKKLLDPVAKHYFFVPDPIELSTEHKNTVSYRIKGEERKAKINGKIYISKSDFKNLTKDEVFALKDLVFVKFDGKKLIEVKQNEIPEKKFQWVSASDSLKCEVWIPHDLLENGEYNKNSLEIAKGYCESACANIKEGEMIQFERFGFCRLDKKTKGKLYFVYSC